MANEIKYQLSLTATKGFMSVANQTAILSADMTGDPVASGVQSIGTTAVAIGIGGVTTAGFSFFRNLSTTNFVEIGTGTGGSFVSFAKLKAGESAIIRLGTNAPTARANTAAINLQYVILSD